MRITFNSLNRHAQSVIRERYADLARLQEQLSTGKRLLRPSDAPVDVANDLKLRSKIAEITQYRKNIEDANGFISITDTAMMSMNDLMQRMRELAVQGASDTLSATERNYIGKEVEQLTRQFLSLLNTTYKGDYVFGGTQTKIPPCPIESSQAGSQENYDQLKMAWFDGTAGTDTPIQLRSAFDNTAITNIIPGSFKLVSNDSLGNRREWINGTDYTIDYVNGTISILSTGSDPAALTVDVSAGGAFNAGPTPPGYYSPNGFAITFDHVTQGKDIFGDTVETAGNIYREVERGTTMAINITGDEIIRDAATGTDLIETLVSLGQSLYNNDRNAIRQSIGAIDNSFQNILSAEARNGSRLNRIETTLSRNDEQVTETTRLQSEIEDAEMTDTITDFSLAETVYNAALKSAAMVLQPSLADYI
jgi:flagellar hook-associated protein 3 FlgL